MNRFPNYNRATNAAYEILKKYAGPYPQIDIMGIIFCKFPNIKTHTYSEMSKKFNIPFYSFAPSEHGFSYYNHVAQKGNIFYNDTKDECIIRFTLAHELGHIVLGHVSSNDVDDKEANCFARNLLAPVPIRDEYRLQSINEICNCFDISEPAAGVVLRMNSNDHYYISRENYNDVNDRAYCYITGYTLSELYGYY